MYITCDYSFNLHLKLESHTPAHFCQRWWWWCVQVVVVASDVVISSMAMIFTQDIPNGLNNNCSKYLASICICTKIPSCLTISICALLNLLHQLSVRSFHMLTVRTAQNWRPIMPMWCRARLAASISANAESNNTPLDLKIMIVSLMYCLFAIPSSFPDCAPVALHLHKMFALQRGIRTQYVWVGFIT